MGSSCCGKPMATIIRVADFEAGILGLENAFMNVYKKALLREYRAYVAKARRDAPAPRTI